MPMLRRCAPKLRRILWCLDPTSYERMEAPAAGLLGRLHRALLYRRERQFFTLADDILLMECSRRHFQRPRYDRFRTKMRWLDLPLLAPCAAEPSADDVPQQRPVPRMLYAGRFYGRDRNPDGLCDALACLARERAFLAEFYTDGSADARLAVCAEETGGMVRAYGLKPHAEILRRMAAADVLLSFGNRGQEIVPSKLFELMGAGKRILHWAADAEDSCLPYLARYPAALVLREDTPPEEAAKRIAAFLDTPVQIDAAQMREIFCRNTPAYTAACIADCALRRDGQARTAAAQEREERC